MDITLNWFLFKKTVIILSDNPLLDPLSPLSQHSYTQPVYRFSSYPCVLLPLPTPKANNPPLPIKGGQKGGRRGHWAKMEALSPEKLRRTGGKCLPPSIKVALPAVFIMHRFSYPSSLEPLRSSGCGCFSKLSFTSSSLAPCSSGREDESDCRGGLKGLGGREGSQERWMRVAK